MIPSSRNAWAEEVRRAMERLRERSPALRARPRGDVLDVLCELLESWRSPDSAWRRALERDLPSATGFSAPVVRAGLRLGLEHWSADALREVVSAELGTASAGPRTAVSGFAVTGIVLAGSIPMPTLLQLMLPLIVGSPVLAKPASRDPLTARLFMDCLRDLDSELGACVEVIDFGRDADSMHELLAAECVVATGDDDTITELSRWIQPSCRLVRHGHRLSVAALGSGCTDGEALAATCRKLALDVVLWDQLGCLSPAAIYVDGGGAAATRVAAELAHALGGAAQELPLGELPDEAATAISGERAEAEVRAAAGQRVRVWRGSELCWTVVLEEDARFRPGPLHRFVRVHPVSGRTELLAALRPLSAQLAGVALDGFEDAGLARELASLGASRICAPGRLQAPPLSWHHDGQPLLLPLARVSDLESQGPD